MTPEPWTFEDFEMESQKTWVIYDDNLARIVAVFYDKDEAKDYLRWRNTQQACIRDRKTIDRMRAERLRAEAEKRS